MPQLKRGKQFATKLAAITASGIDESVYAKVQLLGAPNSRHPERAGRWLDYRALLHLGLDAIRDLARTPVEFDIPDRRVGEQPERDINRELITADKQNTEANSDSATLNRQTLDLIRGDHSPPVGDRHRVLFSAAAQSWRARMSETTRSRITH